MEIKKALWGLTAGCFGGSESESLSLVGKKNKIFNLRGIILSYLVNSLHTIEMNKIFPSRLILHPRSVMRREKFAAW